MMLTRINGSGKLKYLCQCVQIPEALWRLIRREYWKASSVIVNWKATISEHFLLLPGQRRRMHVMKKPSITFLHLNCLYSNGVRVCNLYTTRTYFVYLFRTWPISSQIVNQSKYCKSAGEGWERGGVRCRNRRPQKWNKILKLSTSRLRISLTFSF